MIKKVRLVVMIGCAIQFLIGLFLLTTLPIRSFGTYAFFSEQPASYFSNGFLNIVHVIVVGIVVVWPMKILSSNRRIFAELPAKKKRLIDIAGSVYAILILALCIELFVVL